MYELRVLNGLHRGAALPLIGQQWLIGTEEEADLILFDPGIKPRHCQLALRDNRWILTSEQGKMTDPEGHLVEEITEREEMGPQLVFALDGIWMTIVDAATPWPEESHEAIIPIEPEEEKAPPAKKSLLPFVLGFISAATIAVTSTWAALAPVPKTVSLAETPSASPQLNSPHAVKQYLDKMLTDRELNHSVQLIEKKKSVLLTGGLKKENKERLDRMLERFHKQFTTTVTIDNQVSVTSTQLPFEITQITSGKMGSVVTNNGKRLFVGDELNGIRLVSIDHNKVIFKGKHNYEVIW